MTWLGSQEVDEHGKINEFDETLAKVVDKFMKAKQMTQLDFGPTKLANLVQPTNLVYFYQIYQFVAACISGISGYKAPKPYTVTIPFTGREVYKLNSWMTKPHKPFKFLPTPQRNTLVMECG